MASTRPPGTYSPSARTGRRGGGSGGVAGMVRRAGSDALSMSLRSTAPVGQFGGQHPPPEPAEHKRSGFGVALTCGTLSKHNPDLAHLGAANPGGPTATAAVAADGDGIQATDAGSEAPTDHGRWPTGTFWPASKTPCYADRK